MSQHIKRARLLIVVAGLSLIAAACTSGHDSSDDAGNNNSDSSGGNTTSPKSNRIGSIDLSAIRDAVAVGRPLEIRATVADTDGNPYSGREIRFSTDDGSLSADTETTDDDGLAGITFTAPQATGTARIAAIAGAQTANLPLTVAAGPVAHLSLIGSPEALAFNRQASVSVIATDRYDNPVSDLPVRLTATGSNPNSGFEDPRLQTDDNGRASTRYTTGATQGMDELTASAAGVTSEATSITVDPNAATLETLGLSAGNERLTADGNSSTFLRATAKDIQGRPVQGVIVSFSASAGTLSKPIAVTNNRGTAEVELTSEQRLITTAINAAVAGLNAMTEVKFVPGPVADANSSLTVDPVNLPADGKATAEVIVTLADASGNAVADGTKVVLALDNGTIVGSNSATTAIGRARFTVRAPESEGRGQLEILGQPGLSTSLRYGPKVSGAPTSLSAESSRKTVAVAGVGQVEDSTISIRVIDDNGTPISEAGYNNPTLDNLRVELLSRPNGGEFISGTNAAGQTVDSSQKNNQDQEKGYIDIRSNNGKAQIAFQSGTRPGVVELRAKTLAFGQGDQFEQPENIAASAVLPQLTVASGPPNTLAFTAAGANSVADEGNGVYTQRGTLIVTDKYGNTVADDTSVSLGLIDSVIAEGQGAIEANKTGLKANSFYFDTRCNMPTDCAPSAKFNLASSIVRNNSIRTIRSGDRVLVLKAHREDKMRFVKSADSTYMITAKTAYNNDQKNVHFAVGAALLGAEIGGIDGGNITTGSGRTKNGRVDLRVAYPANRKTIRLGCLGRTANGHYSTDDKRFTVPQSAQLFLTASTIAADATGVSNDTFCFLPLPGAKLTATPNAIDGEHDARIALTLVDGGGIRLPFVAIGVSYRVTARGSGSQFAIDSAPVLANDANRKPQTDINGVANAIIRTNCDDGATCISGDQGVVTFYGRDASVDVMVEIP